ncbi:hypothetical protein J7L85_03040 [candidate division WOR-3 bacterium]|nr:hypothetical protein [candidate division WOR-3 bacterium]
MDEKLKILKMVEEKKISAEEAEELLSALSTPKKGKRTFTFKFGEKGTIIKEFNNIKSVDINIQGCNVELRKGEGVRIEYRGSINTNSKNGMLEIVGKWADVVLFLPGDIDVNIQGRYLNLEGELSANLEMDCKASNIELRILKPINIKLQSKFGNIELSFVTPINQKFIIENKMGNIVNPFSKVEGTGEKSAKIINSFGSVTLKKEEK